MSVRRACIVGFFAAMLGTACGVRYQDEPQVLDRGEVPYGLLSGRATSTGDRLSFVVYLLKGERLVAVPRVVATAATPEVVVDAVVKGPSIEESAAGLTTAIPNETSVLHVTRQGSVVVAEFDARFEEASDLDAAVRQIEATLRELPGVDEVRVLIEGREVVVGEPT